MTDKPHIPNLVGIIGMMGTGKTTTAEMIIEALRPLGVRCVVHPFAYRLKKIARMMGWDGKKDKRGRKLLQMLGTECGRAYDSDLWVKLWDEDVKENYPGEDMVIVDDIRFRNEAEHIMGRGGMLIRMDRSSVAYKGDGWTHASEQLDWAYSTMSELIPCVIRNESKDLDTLRGQVDCMIGDWLYRPFLYQTGRGVIRQHIYLP